MGLSLGILFWFRGTEDLTQIRQQLHMRPRCHSKHQQAHMVASAAHLRHRLASRFLQLAPFRRAALESPGVHCLLSLSLQPCLPACVGQPCCWSYLCGCCCLCCCCWCCCWGCLYSGNHHGILRHLEDRMRFAGPAAGNSWSLCRQGDLFVSRSFVCVAPSAVGL